MASSHRSAIAASVRAEVARSGANRSAVAAAAGVSYPALARRLRGEVAFGADELVGIADLLGVPVAQLLGQAA